MNVKVFNILLVDDCEEDIELMRDALLGSDIPLELDVAENGEEALAKLKGDEESYPDLILLDLNMPKINGHQVLKELKHHDSLKKIPVIILTTSRSPDDVLRCYKNYGNCYVCKPLDYSQYYMIVDKIKEFWLELASLPNAVR